MLYYYCFTIDEKWNGYDILRFSSLDSFLRWFRQVLAYDLRTSLDFHSYGFGRAYLTIEFRAGTRMKSTRASYDQKWRN